MQNSDFIHIIIGESGKEIRTSVTREQFERFYKPKGWQIESEETEEQIAQELHEESKVKNYHKMKGITNQQFDDGLFKEGYNGKV